MRSSVFLVAVLLCGCRDSHDGDRTPSAFMGAYVGTCEQTKDGDAGYLASGIVESCVSDRGVLSFVYTLNPDTDDAMTREVTGGIQSGGQFVGSEWKSTVDYIRCYGTFSLVGDVLDGEIVKRVGDPTATYRLRFALPRR